jgi:hypothetical protein
MRLLLRSNTGEFSLTKDLVGDDTISLCDTFAYMGADAEKVTFGDLSNSTSENKPGYEKIRFCGKEARYDKLQYF